MILKSEFNCLGLKFYLTMSLSKSSPGYVPRYSTTHHLRNNVRKEESDVVLDVVTLTLVFVKAHMKFHRGEP